MALLAAFNWVRKRSGESDVFELGSVAFEDHLSPILRVFFFFLVFMSAEPYDRNLLSVSNCGVPCSEM